mmetsp:Transcript_28291/g.71008  ORF Transcript_28291/g.71008 Transcript_28291/m.71008 type:complete len:256 (-) Transcript_28291:371-1138(-)
MSAPHRSRRASSSSVRYPSAPTVCSPVRCAACWGACSPNVRTIVPPSHTSCTAPGGASTTPSNTPRPHTSAAASGIITLHRAPLRRRRRRRLLLLLLDDVLVAAWVPRSSARAAAMRYIYAAHTPRGATCIRRRDRWISVNRCPARRCRCPPRCTRTLTSWTALWVTRPPRAACPPALWILAQVQVQVQVRLASPSAALRMIISRQRSPRRQPVRATIAAVTLLITRCSTASSTVSRRARARPAIFSRYRASPSS